MNNVLDRLRNKLEENEFKSSFDFESFEISEEDKKFIIEKEKRLSKNFKKNGEILFELCQDLFQVSEKLKKDGSFMVWYTACGLSKDTVSCLLKRYSVYYEFPDKRVYISSLSDLAIKYMTNKNISLDDRLMIVNKNITNAEEIKELLEPLKEENIKEFTEPKKRYFDFKKLETLKKKVPTLTSKDYEQFKQNLELYKKQIKELEILMKEKEKMEENKDNVKLFA